MPTEGETKLTALFMLAAFFPVAPKQCLDLVPQFPAHDAFVFSGIPLIAVANFTDVESVLQELIQLLLPGTRADSDKWFTFAFMGLLDVITLLVPVSFLRGWRVGSKI